MTEQRTYLCPIVAARVTLYRQTFAISGIGCSAAAVLHDHDCCQVSTCPHRYTEACRVQQLNACA